MTKKEVLRFFENHSEIPGLRKDVLFKKDKLVLSELSVPYSDIDSIEISGSEISKMVHVFITNENLKCMLLCTSSFSVFTQKWNHSFN